MTKLNYAIDVAAPREEVWSTMLDDASYRDWTSAFAEGSHYVGKWEEGQKLLFLDGSGQGGMVSLVKEIRFPESVVIQHVGLVQNGLEDTGSEEAKKWAPALEIYRLGETGDGTRLEIETDSTEEMREYFDATWPQALNRLKQLSESQR